MMMLMPSTSTTMTLHTDFWINGTLTEKGGNAASRKLNLSYEKPQLKLKINSQTTVQNQKNYRVSMYFCAVLAGYLFPAVKLSCRKIQTERRQTYINRS